ncbi:MAG: cupredoxin domain-containing protein [Acidimicrobiales bacterium]
MGGPARVALAAGAFALVLAGCGDSDPSPPTAADLREIDLSVDHTIVVDDDGFAPSTLELEAGEVVLIVNEGGAVHSLTADDRGFDTGRMQPGDDTTLVLTEPGEYPFHDVEDPDRTGTLTVRAGG